MSEAGRHGASHPVPPEAALDAYLDALRTGDRHAATLVALGLVQQGMRAEAVVSDFLVRAQAQVGLAWQQARWSVAMEHRASGITEAVTLALADVALRTPGAEREGSAGHVVVACSEGDWHTLPGRMATEVLRIRGFDVTFVGPSVPAADLVSMLGADPPAAVAITCALPLGLSGAWRTATALRAMGTTVIAGGRGFGSQGGWARAIGADMWASDFIQGADLVGKAVGARPAPRGPAGEPEVAREVEVLLRDRDALVAAALERALAYVPELVGNETAVRATADDLRHSLNVVASATVVTDPSVATEFVDWFEDVLDHRSIPSRFVAVAFDCLLDVLPSELVQGRAMALAGRAHCGGRTVGV